MDQSGAEKRAKVEEEAPVAAEAPSEQNVLVDNYHTFSVPVKPEYLIIRTKEISAPEHPDAPTEESQQKKQTHKQERKDRIKRQDVDRDKVRNGDEVCPFGDKCKHQHDAAAFLANAPPPLPGPCYIFQKNGYCSFGVTCRFRTDHIVNGMNIKPAKSEARLHDESNGLPKAVQVQLRKKSYKYEFATPAIKEMNVRNSNKPDVEKMPYREKKQIDFSNKLILAPLTTIGNLPFRRICKEFGADITIGEMAMGSNLILGRFSEWALCRRHESEDVFGIQIATGHIDQAAYVTELLNKHTDADFIDLNCGCPVEAFYQQGLGSGMLNRIRRLGDVVQAMSLTSNVPITVKVRSGKDWNHALAHKDIAPHVHKWGAAALTIHGRSKVQHYSNEANWDYIQQCASTCKVPVIGNGDIYEFEDAMQHFETGKINSLMLARGAIIKPWLFKEIKEKQRYDISSHDRLELLKKYTRYGLEHWGSDAQGVERVRYFLLNWLSFLHRYVPVGIVERFPVKLNQRPPLFQGRDDLETLLGSPEIDDWVAITELCGLGPAPDNFKFNPKHKANSYANNEG